MARRYVYLAATVALAVLVGIVTKVHAQSLSPSQRTFNWLSTRSSKKSAATAKPVKPAAQSTTSTSPPRDTQAVTLANQALSALTGGLAITDATVQGSANFIAGSDQESGTATLEGHAGYESRIVLALSGGNRTEVHNGSVAPPQVKSSGPDAVWHASPLHNCWVDPTWFFPALTIQSALNDSQIAFAYIGQETKLSTAVQHIQISRVIPGPGPAAISLIKNLSQIDMYLDATSSLPIALDFNIHSPKDAVHNIPVEVQFSGWHASAVGQAPSRIQKFIQNSLSLDLNVSTISINSGIPQSDFLI
jgi:hypothetical protein